MRDLLRLKEVQRRLYNDLVHYEVACISDDEQMKEEAIEWCQMLLADLSDCTQQEAAEQIEAEAKKLTN